MIKCHCPLTGGQPTRMTAQGFAAACAARRAEARKESASLAAWAEYHGGRGMKMIARCLDCEGLPPPELEIIALEAMARYNKTEDAMATNKTKTVPEEKPVSEDMAWISELEMILGLGPEAGGEKIVEAVAGLRGDHLAALSQLAECGAILDKIARLADYDAAVDPDGWARLPGAVRQRIEAAEAGAVPPAVPVPAADAGTSAAEDLLVLACSLMAARGWDAAAMAMNSLRRKLVAPGREA